MERTTGNFGEILLRDGLITNSQLDEAIRQHNKTGKPIGKVLVELGFLSEADKLNSLKRRFGCEVVAIEDDNVPPTILAYVPKSFAAANYVVPIRLDPDALVVAMEDPTDLAILDNLKNIVGINIKAVASSSSDIEALIRKMPETSEPIIIIERPLPSWLRAIRYSAFPILCFLPIPAFILGVRSSNWLFNIFMKANKFDIFLYFLIGWGFWAIILYEINGLIFGSSEKKEKPDKKDKDEF